MFLEIGRYEEAEAAFREAIRVDPAFAKAHNNLGLVLRHYERYQEAEAALREAVRLDPGSAAVHRNLASVVQARKRGSWRKYLPITRPHR